MAKPSWQMWCRVERKTDATIWLLKQLANRCTDLGIDGSCAGFVINIFENVAEFFSKHSVSVTLSSLSLHFSVLSLKFASSQLACYHFHTLLGTWNFVDFTLYRRYSESLFFIFASHLLSIVLSFDLTQHVKMVLGSDHFVVGNFVQVFSSSFVFLSKQIVLVQVFLFQSVDFAGCWHFLRLLSHDLVTQTLLLYI